MHRAPVPCTDLHIVFASPFHGGESSHLRTKIFATESWYQEYRMVGTSTSIYSCEKSLPIQTICATYRTRSAGDHWRRNRSVVYPAESLLGGIPAVGICPGRRRPFHFCTTAHQSPCRHFCLGEIAGEGLEV